MLNKKNFERACKVMPGGVNSPIRSFKSVGGSPIFIDRGQGAYVFDTNQKKYIDYVLSWGPLALGHADSRVIKKITETAQKGTSFGAPTELETKLAEFITSKFEYSKSIEMLRFVNSGTEATMSALRLARAYTKRDKIIKFSGNYHGHADMLLVQAGSGLAECAESSSAGVNKQAISDTLVAQFNNIESVKKIFLDYPDQIAAVIFEPVAGNMGLIKPKDNFLENLSELCKAHNTLLICDEVMTGFRAALPGAQTIYNIKPDITCLGKVIGGGLPVAAYGARKEIMQEVSPLGSMYQAGTLSGNPLGMAAGLATLEGLFEADKYKAASDLANSLISGIKKIARDKNILIQADSIGTMFGFFFLKKPGEISNFESAQRLIDTEKYSKFFHHMLDAGHYFAPSAYEAGFMSTKHTQEDIIETLKAIESTIA